MGRKSAPPQLGSATGNWRSKKPSWASLDMPTIPEVGNADDSESSTSKSQAEAARITGAEAATKQLTYRERMQDLEVERRIRSETVPVSSRGTTESRGRTRQQGQFRNNDATTPERRRHTLSRSAERAEGPDASLLGLIDRLRVRMNVSYADQLEAAREFKKLAEQYQLTTEEKHKMELAKARMEVQGLIWMTVAFVLIALVFAYIAWCAYNGPEFAYLRQRRIEALGLAYGLADD
ncbi:hypothetical protein AMS68_001147 [Peltaster fructicola]|uniref:Uncharacterized protein n=1 Tax=Peltaster fructicola TaxID=286661 RepID=A0A6H0XMA6_9PEZI|nr:hypothetical protein AMS68_001147 [Peltaster fructicola]